ncbi:hypothetical protein ACTFIW_006076 [Dictyostelium discoideum]
MTKWIFNLGNIYENIIFSADGKGLSFSKFKHLLLLVHGNNLTKADIVRKIMNHLSLIYINWKVFSNWHFSEKFKIQMFYSAVVLQIIKKSNRNVHCGVTSQTEQQSVEISTPIFKNQLMSPQSSLNQSPQISPQPSPYKTPQNQVNPVIKYCRKKGHVIQECNASAKVSVKIVKDNDTPIDCIFGINNQIYKLNYQNQNQN